eukprot:UN17648
MFQASVRSDMVLLWLLNLLMIIFMRVICFCSGRIVLIFLVKNHPKKRVYSDLSPEMVLLS